MFRSFDKGRSPMEGSVMQATTPAEVLAKLIEKGHGPAIALARREYEQYADASGINHRRTHIDPDAITYRRGRWHAAVKMLALLADLEVSTEEPDLLEFAHALSAYSPE